MKKSMLLLFSLLLASCARVTPPPPPQAKPSSIVEVHFNNIGLEKPTGQLGVVSSQTSITKQTLAEVNGLQLALLNVEALTDRTLNKRWVQADFVITNNSSTSIERLYITPVELVDDADPDNNLGRKPTISGTPFTGVWLFDGTSVPSRAVDLQTGPAMYFDRYNLKYLQDLDATPFYPVFDPAFFPIDAPTGFQEVIPQGHSYFLSEKLEPGQSAPLTLSIRYDTDPSNPANNPFSFTMQLAFGQNNQEFKRVGAPLNQAFSASGGESSITLDAAGHPVVAYTQFNGLYTDLLVKQWDGNDWFEVSAQPNLIQTFAIESPSIAHKDANQFAVAWSELSDPFTNQSDVYVKQYDPVAADWIPLGSVDMVPNNSATEPAVALNASNRPMVVWTEPDDSSGINQVQVKEWDGTSWVSLGGSLNFDPSMHAGLPDIATDPAGNPYVTWTEDNLDGSTQDVFVKHWNGSSWDLIGTGSVDGSADGTEPSLAVGPTGEVTLAYIEDDQVKVLRWDDAGSIWTALGGSLNIDPLNAGYEPKVSLKPDGNPVVVWEEVALSGQLLAKTWDGSNWVRFGDALNSNLNLNAFRADTVTDGTGKTFVSFTEDENCSCGSTVVQVKTFP